MKRMVFSVLVDNIPGVLSRVTGLFSRRGYNIDSLTVGETENSKYSRMTITVTGETLTLEQIEKQLAKLEDVEEIIELEDAESVTRELVLVKVQADRTERQGVIAISNVFRAKVVDVSMDSMMIELTGNQAKLDKFINLLDGYKVLELVRTGITGLARG